MRINKLHLHLARNRDGFYSTYFNNAEGRCLILRGLGVLFVVVLKAGN